MKGLDGKTRGFGFVTFESAEVVEKVLAQEHTLLERPVEV